MGKAVHSRSGKNLPPHRPRKVFDRKKVVELRRQGMSLRGIAKEMGIGLGTVTRTLKYEGGGPTHDNSPSRNSATATCEPRVRAVETGRHERSPHDDNRTASTQQAKENHTMQEKHNEPHERRVPAADEWNEELHGLTRPNRRD